MPVFQLDEHIAFPRPELADESGLLAVGGDLSVERLLLAYSLGIFPWYNENLPILWHSPDPRMVLLPDELYVGRSLRKAIRRRPYELKLDHDFEQVIARCANVERPEQDGTWVTDDMQRAYVDLHDRGYAHSVEAYQGDELVGGLYGVSLGSAFFGESMFAVAPDASKIAFVTLVEQLAAWHFDLIDCQVYTDHLARFGAAEWPRDKFLLALERSLHAQPTRRGIWSFDDTLLDATSTGATAPAAGPSPGDGDTNGGG